MFGSVWNDLSELHNYSVIIFECQKVTFLVVEAIFFFKIRGGGKRCLKLPEIDRKYCVIIYKCQKVTFWVKLNIKLGLKGDH